MKIIAASDIHGRLDLLHPDDADIFVIAGDIAPTPFMPMAVITGYQQHWIHSDFLPFLKRYPKTQFVFTPGNHDFWSDTPFQFVKWPDNAHCLIDDGFEYKGLSFYGTPWCPTINGRWVWEANERSLGLRFRMIPKGLDVLITHTPPLVEESAIDTPIEGIWANTHLGSSVLTKAIEKVKPRFVFCGHIHTGDHSSCKIGDSECRNVSLLDERYEPAYEQFEGKVEPV